MGKDWDTLDGIGEIFGEALGKAPHLVLDALGDGERIGVGCDGGECIAGEFVYGGHFINP